MVVVVVQYVVTSVLFYTVVCWGGSISKDTSRLDKLIRPLVTVAERKTLDKLLDIIDIDNDSQPLHTIISNQRSLSSDRLLLPKYRTNRLKNPFVPHAIILYNSSLGGRRKAKRTEVKDW